MRCDLFCLYSILYRFSILSMFLSNINSLFGKLLYFIWLEYEYENENFE